MNNKGNNRERNAYDSRFKDIIRNSTVLSKIIKDNVDGMENLTLDEIKGCLDMEDDGKTVKGRTRSSALWTTARYVSTPCSM